MTLFPFLNLYCLFSPSFFLFYYFFMEKTIDKLIKCLQPLTLILSIFFSSENVMLEKVKVGHLKIEGHSFMVGIHVCVYICTSMYISSLHFYIYTHTHTHISVDNMLKLYG